MGYNFSDKQLADYPFQGGNIDSPVVIYEDPPEEGGVLITLMSHRLTPINQTRLILILLVRFMYLKGM